MRSTSSLLIDEPPLQVLPTLAKRLGLNRAIILQQVHYCLRLPRCFQRDGKPWVYNSYPEWQEGHFKFWDLTTIKRGFLSLEKDGLLESAQFDSDRGQMRKYYTIDYQKLASFPSLLVQSSDQPAPTIGPDCPNLNGTETPPERPERPTSPFRSKRKTIPFDPFLADEDPNPEVIDPIHQLLADFCGWGPVGNIINFRMRQQLVATTAAFRKINADLTSLPEWQKWWEQEDWRGRKGERPSKPETCYDTWPMFQEWMSRQSRPQARLATAPAATCTRCDGNGVYLSDPNDLDSPLRRCLCRTNLPSASMVRIIERDDSNDVASLLMAK